MACLNCGSSNTPHNDSRHATFDSGGDARCECGHYRFIARCDRPGELSLICGCCGRTTALAIHPRGRRSWED